MSQLYFTNPWELEFQRNLKKKEHLLMEKLVKNKLYVKLAAPKIYYICMSNMKIQCNEMKLFSLKIDR